MSELVVNLSNPREKRMLLETIRGLEGPHRVEVVKYRPRRTDRQNRYYWPCFVQPLAEFLREQGECYTDQQAHELLKAKFLRQDVHHPLTGRCVGETVRSTTDLNTSEFNEYLDQCAFWLADMFGIVVPEPDVYREMERAEA